MVMTQIIRVLLADDHPVVRVGIKTILAAEPNLIVVAEAADGDEAQQLCQELQPDVLLLDLNMPGLPSAELVSCLHDQCSSIRVLVLTAYDEDAHVRDMIKSNVAGYVLKDEAPDTLIQAIHTAVRGGVWFSQSVVNKLAKLTTDQPVHQFEEVDLTLRERQILSMIAKGWENTRLAAELNLAEQTICNYVSRIYAKIGVSSRAEAIVWTVEHGLAKLSSQ